MTHRPRTGSRWWYLLLLIPIVGLLATPIYTRDTPELFGFPFFYWYQFAWVPLSTAIVYFVYTRTRTVGPAPDGGRGLDDGAPFVPGPERPIRTGRREPVR